MDSSPGSPARLPRDGLRRLISLSSRKKRTIHPKDSTVRMADERAAPKGFGECKKCSANVSSGSSQGLYPHTAQRKFFLVICLPIPFFPIFFFYLSIEHRRMNICFPAYCCLLRNQTGHPEKAGVEALVTPPGAGQ